MRLKEEGTIGFINIVNGPEIAQITFEPTDVSLSGLTKVIEFESFNINTG